MCPTCKVVFQSKDEMMKHYTSAHPEAIIYNCSICDKNFVTTNGLSNHMFSNHERKVSLSGCKYCGNEFGSPQELRQHIQVRALK